MAKPTAAVTFKCTDVGDSEKSIAFKLTPVPTEGDLGAGLGTPIVIELAKPGDDIGKRTEKGADLDVFELGALYTATFVKV